MKQKPLNATADISSIEARLPKCDMFESLDLDPFANTRDTRFFFHSPAHKKALFSLQALLEDGNRGFGILSGDPGLGKTLLRTVLYGKLDPLRYVGVSIETALLDFDELLLEIISQIRGERVQSNELPDRYSRLAELKSQLTEQVVNSGRHLVIMIDEAQGLDRETLEGLRNLSNISSEQSNLMTFILIGGTKLESSLRMLPELSQRIGIRVSLTPFDLGEIKKYVQHRLMVAGYQGKAAFSERSWQLLQQHSRGVPRAINQLLRLAADHLQRLGLGFGGSNLEEALSSQACHERSQTPASDNLRF